MIDTPKFPDSSMKISPGTVAPKVTGHGTGTIQQLKPDTILNAFVARHDVNGNAVLKIPAGEVTISSILDLKNGSNVILKILINNKLPLAVQQGALPFNFQAKIVSVDGQPPAPPEGYTPPKTNSDIPAYNVVKALSFTSSQTANALQYAVPNNVAAQSNISSDATIVNVKNGMILDSVVISVGKNAQAYLPQQAAAIKPADAVILHVLSVKLPDSGINNPPTSIQSPVQPQPKVGSNNLSLDSAGIKNPSLADIAVQSLPQNTTKLPYSTSVPPPTILPGQEQNFVTNRPTDNVLTNTTQITNNQLFTGTVVGTEKSGEIVLKTPLGTLKLANDAALPKGTELQLEVLRLGGTNSEKSMQASSLDINKLFQEQKSLLSELVQTVHFLGGEQANKELASRIPVNDKQFFARMLWFLAGVKSGNERFWLGNNITRMLEQAGKGELLNNLHSHFALLGRVAEGLPNSNWNMFLFPVFDGQQFQHGLMFTRHYKEGEEEVEQDGTRFVVEVDLSNIGPLQLDGFVKNLRSKKAIDLFVRSKRTLDKEVEADVREIFMASIEIMGINGNISFQEVEDFPVRPSAELGDTGDWDGSILA